VDFGQFDKFRTDDIGEDALVVVVELLHHHNGVGLGADSGKAACDQLLNALGCVGQVDGDDFVKFRFDAVFDTDGSDASVRDSVGDGDHMRGVRAEGGETFGELVPRAIVAEQADALDGVTELDEVVDDVARAAGCADGAGKAEGGERVVIEVPVVRSVEVPILVKAKVADDGDPVIFHSLNSIFTALSADSMTLSMS